MKSFLQCLIAATVLSTASTGWAQTAPAPALTVFPPPAIDAPGAVPAPATSAAMPLPRLPAMHTDTATDAHGTAPPTVTVTRHEGQLIEQYYDGGQLYMVRVHPEHGVPYTYYVEKGHQLNRGAGAPPVNPVLFTILKWGKPSKPVPSDGN